MGSALDKCDYHAVLDLMAVDQEAETQALACDTLFRIVLEAPETASALVGKGIEQILQAMATFPADADVQKEAATTLWRIMSEAGYGAAKQVLDSGGFHYLNAAATSFSELSEAHEAALLALGTLEKHGLVVNEAAAKLDLKGCPIVK